jgi:DNA adenine methylase
VNSNHHIGVDPPGHKQDMEVGPILRWAGSKKKSVQKLKSQMPANFEKYIEVFAGSACLFFSVNAKRAIVADNNRELMRFYKSISRDAGRVYDKFRRIKRVRETYYRVRSQISNTECETLWAARFFYLNRNCFNGIYRTNMKGKFNVPYSDQRVSAYPSRSQFIECAKVLSRTTLICKDFAEVCRTKVGPGDFVYLDPPYYVPSVRIFREYSEKPFTEIDFARLDEALDLINSRGAYFLLSYPDCGIARKLSAHWYSSTVSVPRVIAGNIAARRRVSELIIRNYDLRRTKTLC